MTPSLDQAWRDATNHQIAAHILGYIRHAALQEPLLPYAQRVDNALHTLLAPHAWTNPQRQWLQRIAARTTANGIVDREAFDAPDQRFNREGGGFTRLDRLFNGELLDVLGKFNEAIWQQAA